MYISLLAVTTLCMLVAIFFVARLMFRRADILRRKVISLNSKLDSMSKYLGHSFEAMQVERGNADFRSLRHPSPFEGPSSPAACSTGGPT
jgi:hypothetical protein